MPSQTGSIDLTAQVSANNNAKDYSDTVVDNLEIGGRNLLLNSKVPVPTLAPYSNSVTSKYNTPALDGIDYYYCSGTRYWRIDFPTLISGETYNLWFDIARSADSRPVFVKIGSTEQNIGTALGRAWKRLGLSFVASTDTYAEIRVAIASTGTQNDYIAALRNVKLEKGDKATDWTPAPEDVNADISAAESSAKGYADTKKTEAISAAATDATNKANAAAQTATNYITADANGISIHMANESNTYQRQTSNATTFYVGGKKRSQVGADGLHVYVDMAETEVAKFTSAGAQIGKSGESHILQDYHSLQMIDKEGITYFKVEDLCDESGTLEVTDTFESDGESKVYVLTYTATGTDYTVTVSDDSGGSVQKQTTKITFNTYPTVGAVITVTYTTASELTKSYTFGKRKANADVGAMSVADGLDTAASGRQSHASGYLTTASGSNSYAGGARTTAAGRNSRATGEDTTANGWGSNADGLQTIAGYNYQTVIGKWNENHYNSAFEIGNGVTGARSNAFVVDWDGNIIAKGMAGMIQMFAGSTAPRGWLICDGSAVSRTSYATLFAAIGTTWGAGDGSTTFNIPDLRGRTPIGAGTGSSLTARTLAAKGGSENIQAHTHAFTQPTVKTELKFQKNVASGSAINRVAGSNLSNPAETSTYTATVTGGAVGAVSGASTGTAGNMPPFAVINFIICTGKTS